MSTWGHSRRPSRRRSGVIGAAVVVAVAIGLLLTLGAASGRPAAQHRSGDATASRAAMSSTHSLLRAQGHASLVSRASSHSALHAGSSSSSRGLGATASGTARLLASTGCGAPNTIADATGFEDNNGNLTPSGVCTDWNSFAPPTWTGTAPYQTYTTTQSGFQFYGRTDAVNSATDTSFASGASGKESVNCPATSAGQITPKDDLARIYIAGKKTPGGDTYLFLAWVRAPQSTPNSDLHVAFEFNQSTTPCANGDGLVPRTNGDLLIGYEFQSATPTLTLSVWNNGAWGNPTTLTSANSEGEVWTGSGTTSDLLKPSGAANPGQDEFGEAGLDLTKAIQGQLGGGKSCETFGSVYGASRTSGQSSTANMEDLVGPQPINLSNCVTPTVVTTLHNAATNTVIANNSHVDLGSSVYDTAAFDPATLIAGTPPTGSVSYTFFTNGTCSGTGTAAGGGALVGGVAPNSNPTGALAPGSYSFDASYSAGNDQNYADSGPSTCEPFTVDQASSTTATVVNDATTNAPWAGTETTGATAYDTATVTSANGFATPSGTVSYRFFANGTCNGAGTAAGSVSLNANGSVPNSTTTAPLAAGSYSFRASYSGDTNYTGSTGTCETFTVGQGPSTTATVVFDAGTNLPWSGLEVTGDRAFDTSSVTPSAGITATGSVSYTFFGNGTCNGAGSAAGGGALDAQGNSPNSTTTAPLAAGDYSFQATYSGDANYTGSTGPCESFSVNAGPSSTATVVYDAGTSTPWAGTESAGSSAYDTATVTPSAGFTPTGTVTYAFFANGSCQKPPSSTDTVTLAGGNVPQSSTEGPLAAGSYSFEATYSGDSNYAASTGPCEPFSLGVTKTTTDTVVFDAATNKAWAGTEKTGASAYDTATVSGQPGILPTGTVDYTIFANGACTGAGTLAGTVTLVGGTVPQSPTEGPLGAGDYSFQATYGGDSNYSTSTGPCEPFAVAKGTSKTDTTVFDAGTKALWGGTETTGASAYDTSTVTPSDGITATGTVDYTFFTNQTCQGPGTPSGSVSLDGAGKVPNSDPQGPLAAGGYSFQATYNGDSNYAASTGPCEPFTVGQGTSTTGTTVFDAATNKAWSGTEETGAAAYDTSSVTPSSPALTATGTVTYTFFANGTCNGAGTAAGGGALDAQGKAPNSNTEGTLAAGDYSFQATYSGDTNYAGSTGPCEKFTVAQGTSSTDTTVFDATTNAAWTGTETTGASAYDTSTVTPSAGITATGTVDYTFFANGTCNGAGTAAGSVQLDAQGHVPNSNTEATLVAGDYSFQATYNGDSNYAASTGPCEPFTVGQGTSTTGTTVFDAATNAAWTGNEAPGASAYDTSTVKPSSGITATGTVTYTFFANDTCQGSGTLAGTMNLDAKGNVPSSSTEGPLGAGGYSFVATYSGDSNYATSTGPCEPFRIGVLSPAVTTTANPSSVVVASAASTAVSDVATFTGGFQLTGQNATFTLYNDPSCALANATDVTGNAVIDGNGIAKFTGDASALDSGTYYWGVSYAGDANNNPVDECGGAEGVQNEVLTIVPTSPTITTTLSSSAVNAGTAVNDTAKLAGATAAAGGTVTYSVYSDSACTNKVADGGTVNVANGAVPDSKAITFNTPGTYYWQASYSGDKNNNAAISACTDEKLVVAPLIDLAITKVGSPSPATLGKDNITWTMVVTNNGPDTATGATIADPLPSGNTFVSVSTTQGSCTGGAILTCDLGTIAVGGTVTITLVTTPSTTGNQVNTVTVAGDQADTNTANNTATATVLVVGPATPPVVYCVAVSKITPSQLFVGRKTMLTIHLTKHGRAAKGVRVRIRGPKIDVKTRPSNARGIVKQVVKMKKAGIDTFIPLASKHCNTKRLGVTGVFTPPVTG